MSRTRKIVVGVAVGIIALGAGAGAVLAGGGGDNEQPITGEELDRASAAALEHVGEGKVTDTEVGDEESYYEVEVTRDDGSQVDVQLDRDFHVVDTTSDRDIGTDDSDR
ncbi:MAG: hypothetical protein ACRD0O_18550 [Acidimicrobiia bacterium]